MSNLGMISSISRLVAVALVLVGATAPPGHAQSTEDVVAALETDRISVSPLGDPVHPRFGVFVGTGVDTSRAFQLMAHGDFADRVQSITFSLDNHDFSLGMPPIPIGELSALRALESATFQYTAGQDWQALRQLTRLRQLRFHGAALEDLSQIAAATQIETLELQSMPVRSLAPLAGMPNLRALSLVRIQLADASLWRLPQVTSLTLRDMPRSALAAAEGMVSLERIALHEMDASDLSMLSRFPSLRSVDIRATIAPDLDTILSIDGLTTLTINAPLPSTAASRICRERRSITELKLRGMPAIEDLSIFDACPVMHVLEVSSDAITSLGPISTRTELQRLAISPHAYVGGTVPITDLRPLAGLSQLRHLSLRGVQASDFSPLQNLSNLEYLDLSGTNLSSIDFVRQMPNLRVLIISDTRVRDLGPLVAAPNLEVLDIADTRVRDLAPLAGLTRLQRILMLHAPIRDTSILDTLPLLTVR